MTALLICFVGLLLYVGFFSALGIATGQTLLPYWALTLGVVVPQVIAFLAFALFSLRGTTQNAQQGWAMAGLFPVLISIFLSSASSVFSLFFWKGGSFWPKFQMGMAVSIATVLILAIAIYRGNLR